jgi:hypothetical protein
MWQSAAVASQGLQTVRRFGMSGLRDTIIPALPDMGRVHRKRPGHGEDALGERVPAVVEAEPSGSVPSLIYRDQVERIVL